MEDLKLAGGLLCLRFMPGLLRSFCQTVLCAALLAPCVWAEESVQPPFGLEWETGGRELEAKVAAAHAKVAERKRTVDGEIWTVEELPQQALQRAIFTLKRDALVEVELQYGGQEWDVWTFDEFMHRVRTNLDSRYGTGRQVARQRDDKTAVMQTLVGYTWKVSGRLLELVYFAAQDEKNAMRLVSLHYKMGTPEKAAQLASH